MNNSNVKSVRAEYYRDWRKKNPERVREINARYWMRRAERLEKDEKQKIEGEVKHDGTGNAEH